MPSFKGRRRFVRGDAPLPAAGHDRWRPQFARQQMATAVINAMEEFKNDFRCIPMDQRKMQAANPAVTCTVD